MNVNMSETARLILGLRNAGWDEKDINDFILYIETGEEQYKPQQKNHSKKISLRNRLKGMNQGRAGLPPLPRFKINYSKT